MGSFPSRQEQEADIAAAEEHFEYYEWLNMYLCVVYVLGFLFNAAQLFVIASTRALRSNSTMHLVAAVGMTDLVLALWCAPHYIVQAYHGAPMGAILPLNTAHVYYQTFGWFQSVCFVASVCTFALCAYERFRKVTTPMNTLQPRQLKRAYAGLWLLSITMNCLNFAVGGYRMVPCGLYSLIDWTQVGSFVLTVICIIFPLGGAAYAYIAIYHCLKGMSRHRTGTNDATYTEAIVAYKLLFVIVVYLTCWGPPAVWMFWDGFSFLLNLCSKYSPQ